jgi:hypothetical protein
VRQRSKIDTSAAKAAVIFLRQVVAEATSYGDWVVASTESRSLSPSRVRQTAAEKKKRGTPFGMRRGWLFSEPGSSPLENQF